MLYILFTYLKFWQCSCEDSRHYGDNPNCPRHSSRARWFRGVLLGLAVLVIYFLYFR